MKLAHRVVSFVLLFVWLASTTGCMHWARVDDITQAAGEERVRVTMKPGAQVSTEGRDAPAIRATDVVLERPTLEQLRAIRDSVTRVEVRRPDPVATGFLIAGIVSAAAFTVAAILGVALAVAISSISFAL
jgi:hypothetical protein